MDSPLDKPHIKLAKLAMHSATICGRVSLLAFVLFLFFGPFNLFEINGLRDKWPLWDLFLSALFFVQHSTMVRQGLKNRLAQVIPSYYHGAIFTLASGLVLLSVVLFWQPSHSLLIQLPSWMQWLANLIFFSAAVGMGWSVWALGGFDPFGLGPIKARLSGKPLRLQPFTAKGPYLWVRHPLYFFTLVMIWSHADLTADRLLFNLTWSGWIWLGTRLEEKDLLSEFGKSYQAYQKQVPMLIPWKIFHKNQPINQ